MSSIKSFLILIHSIIFLFFFSGCSGHNNLEPKISIEILELEKKHQKQILIQEMIASSRTLHKVSWPILKNNTDSCTNSKIIAFGFIFATEEDLPKDSKYTFNYIDTSNDFIAKDHIKLPVVISVAPRSPAYNAGLQEGDKIITVNNIEGSKIRNKISALSNNNEMLKLRIIRENKKHDISILGEEICSFNVQPLPSTIPNAYADGFKIYITIPAIKFSNSDDELAFLIGHELAHNILHYKSNGIPEAETLPISYQEKPKLRRTMDIFVWQSLRREQEADIKGIHYAIKGGYNLKKAADYWRRLSIFNPELIENSSSFLYKGNAFRASTIDTIVKKLDSQKAKE